jgi:putative sigma-54 modulation protein
MRLELTGRHVQITPVLRRLVDEKLGKLERLLNHSAVSVQTVLTLERHLHRADITLHARGEKFLHCCASAANWEASVNEAINKLSQQAHRMKGKWEARKRRGKKGAPPSEQPTAMAVKPAKPSRPAADRPRMPRILRASRQAVKPMSVADAARQIDADRDAVIVFRDVETESISVLYRRANGELTLVETEA